MENADYREVCKRLADRVPQVLRFHPYPFAICSEEQLRMEKNSGQVELSQFAEVVRQRLGLPCE